MLTFDYKGWGDSEGPKSRLSPYGRVIDSQAALTFLGAQAMVDADRLGIYGTSYGGATVVWTAAVDPRVKVVVSVVGIGHGRRWMRSVRRPDEFVDLLERSKADRIRRVMTGQSEFADRSAVLLPDRQSAELAAAARRGNPGAVGEIPLEYIDDTLGFHPEWVVDKIAPRPVLFITSDDDRLVPPDESEALYAKAGEPKKLIVLKGWGHYEVYTGEAFRQVIAPTIAWYQAASARRERHRHGARLDNVWRVAAIGTRLICRKCPNVRRRPARPPVHEPHEPVLRRGRCSVAASASGSRDRNGRMSRNTASARAGFGSPSARRWIAAAIR